MTQTEPIAAWWFTASSGRLSAFDDREPGLGVMHTNEGIDLRCPRRLRGSVDLLSALYQGIGPVVWRVELSGLTAVLEHEIVAEARKYVAGGVDVSPALSRFARLCALSVIGFWDPPMVVRDWLLDDGGDGELREEARAVLVDIGRPRLSEPTRSAAVATFRAARVDPRSAAASAAVEACSVLESFTSFDYEQIIDRQNRLLTEMVTAEMEGDTQ